MWLENNNIPYETIDISENAEAYQFLKSEGHRSVPQIYHNNELFVSGGFTGLSKQDPKILKERMGYRDAA
jgi:hypothetical protein